jgi:hypothetical protein
MALEVAVLVLGPRLDLGPVAPQDVLARLDETSSVLDRRRVELIRGHG